MKNNHLRPGHCYDFLKRKNSFRHSGRSIFQKMNRFRMKNDGLPKRLKSGDFFELGVKTVTKLTRLRPQTYMIRVFC